jgi:hypothetical protein
MVHLVKLMSKYLCATETQTEPDTWVLFEFITYYRKNDCDTCENYREDFTQDYPNRGQECQNRDERSHSTPSARIGGMCSQSG